MNKKSFTVSFLASLFLLLCVGYVYAATVTLHLPSSNSFLNSEVSGTAGNITLNASVTIDNLEVNVSNVTFWYRTSPSGSWIPIGVNNSGNITADKGNMTFLHFWNISTLADGATYEVNATANNDSEAIGSVVSTVVTIDHSTPGVTIEALDPITENVKTEFFFGDKILLRCTRDDAFSGFNDTNISLMLPGTSISGGVFDFFERTAQTGTTSASYEVTFEDTRELGDYFVICGVKDRAGLNENSTNLTFSIITRPPQGSTRPAGFVNPVGTKIITGEADLGRLTSAAPISVQLRKGSNTKLDVKGTTYTFSIKELSEGSLTLSAGNNDVTIAQGASSEADLDGDGSNDVKITYHKQFKKGSRATADVTFAEVSTPVQAPPSAGETGSDTGKEPVAAKASSTGNLLVTVIVIVVIIVVGYFLIKGKKK